MEDIGVQLAIRDRFLRNMWKQLTPSQRLARIDQLQQRASYILDISPNGRQAFMRRNFKARVSDDRKNANAS